ncbi:YisL family protein [Weissella viridescens]|uniref:YisL family protein n=1 Tax=Weissella viridescens TaxID=1629 RepID=UPI003AA86E24
MIFVWIHLITWVVLFVVVSVTLFSRNEKLSKINMMVARLGYLFAIGSGLMLLPYAYNEHPGLTILKVVVAVAVIGLIEMGFARKQRQTLHTRVAFIIMLLILIVGLFGIYLAKI